MAAWLAKFVCQYVTKKSKNGIGTGIDKLKEKEIENLKLFISWEKLSELT